MSFERILEIFIAFKLYYDKSKIRICQYFYKKITQKAIIGLWLFGCRPKIIDVYQ